MDEDGLTGVTSNPAIFEKAIDGSDDYRSAIEEISKDHGLAAKDVFEILAVKDIQDAADVLRPVYDQTKAHDGYVSLEVAPDLANDTARTLDEARRLWKAVGRPNVMIKVPATPEGVPAIRTLLSEGINVNVTLLFARSAYEAVAQAYIEGLEARAAKGQSVAGIASVASFFVSRIDTAVDAQLETLLKTATGADKARLEGLLGKVAIANAKLAYASYKKIFSGPRWQALASKGAQAQRVLWASTGTKNPRYLDVLYVEELIGPDTVNTVPPETLSAFRDHGRSRPSLEEDVAGATETLAALEKSGVSLEKVTAELLADGLKKFVEPFTKLLKAVERRCREANRARINAQSYTLPDSLQAEVTQRLADWDGQGGTRRLWQGDASLWTGSDEAAWIGWIGIVDQQLDDLPALTKLRDEIKKRRLHPRPAPRDGWIEPLPGGLEGDLRQGAGLSGAPRPGLHRPRAGEGGGGEGRSGEDPLHRLQQVGLHPGAQHLQGVLLRSREAGRWAPTRRASRFIAVTDPGSNLEKEARADGFRHIFAGVKTVGGRYSALSNFGMVPAAVMGLDVERLLDEAARMLSACAPGVPAVENHGLVLGTILGVAARKGIDKLTIVASPGIYDLGAWLEQLIAESTGKDGKGIIPVDRETLAAPEAYGDDRLFAYLRLEDAPDAAQDAAVAALEKAGRPVVRIRVASKYDLAEEFVRWEIAAAIAGVDPRDQPLQPAGRGGQQDRDEDPHLGVREDGQAARGGALLRG